eukprot:326494-Amphidinium_carterae.2
MDSCVLVWQGGGSNGVSDDDTPCAQCFVQFALCVVIYNDDVAQWNVGSSTRSSDMVHHGL